MSKIFFRNIWILFILVLMMPHGVFAHASIEKANPAPDSQLDKAPKEIYLQFNERLEKELYSIKVFDENGELISENETKISTDQKSLSQDLPALSDGLYTISYKVISADGHPVDGSYVVSIGEGKVLNPSAFDIHTDGDKNDFYNTIYSLVRILYYLSLLLTTGWIIWRTLNKIEDNKMYRKWAKVLQTALLISTIVIGAMQFTELMEGWSVKGLLSILTGTSAGISWLVSILLSVLGFVLLLRFCWLDSLWVLLLLTAKSINGHAMGFEPKLFTILLDIVHLLAATIWAGGLLYILANWKNQRENIREFLPKFSQFALLSLLVLTVTGTASVLIFLPKISYVLYTKWGILLLVKITFVLLVVVIGGAL
ncbi:copper resistance CopC/CopD family protein [Robertmurraya sp. Marseille-Q9965]